MLISVSRTPYRVTPERHLLGAQRGGFVRSETGTPHSEPFDESSARILQSQTATPQFPSI